MYKNYQNSFRAVLLTASVFFLFLFNSCARKISFAQSSVVPAATGTVKIKKDNNNNYAISISISHLAPAERLQPPGKTYVAWMETDQNSTKNLGQFQSNGGFFSGALKASLVAVTTFRPARIFITSEMDPAVSYPHGQSVLTTTAL